METNYKKIEIKSLFSNFHEVDKKTARKYVKGLLERITTMSKQEAIYYIEKTKLRGISVKELFEEE